MLDVLRGVAQSGLARMVRVHEVGGSNPLAPTNTKKITESENEHSGFFVERETRTGRTARRRLQKERITESENEHSGFFVERERSSSTGRTARRRLQKERSIDFGE